MGDIIHSSICPPSKLFQDNQSSVVKVGNRKEVDNMAFNFRELNLAIPDRSYGTFYQVQTAKWVSFQRVPMAKDLCKQKINCLMNPVM